MSEWKGLWKCPCGATGDTRWAIAHWDGDCPINSTPVPYDPRTSRNDLAGRVEDLETALRDIIKIDDHEPDCNKSGDFLTAREIAQKAISSNDEEPLAHCSECDHSFATHSPTCPNCGALLDEDDNAPSHPPVGKEPPFVEEKVRAFVAGWMEYKMRCELGNTNDLEVQRAAREWIRKEGESDRKIPPSIHVLEGIDDGFGNVATAEDEEASK